MKIGVPGLKICKSGADDIIRGLLICMALFRKYLIFGNFFWSFFMLFVRFFESVFNKKIV